MSDVERLNQLEYEHREGRGLTAGEVQWVIELARKGLQLCSACHAIALPVDDKADEIVSKFIASKCGNRKPLPIRKEKE